MIKISPDSNSSSSIPFTTPTKGVRSTHLSLDGNWKSVAWIYDTFDNNFETDHILTKYLKEVCRISSDQHNFFKYFP